MPRTNGGTGPFVLNPIYLAIPGTTILATQHNTPLEDIEDTFNIPQPIAYGGTQAATPRAAMDNLFIVGANATSAGTLDLDNTTGTFVSITGTTTVTAVALTEDKIRYGRADAALPFTASATLIVNGSTTASYTCEAGDMIMFVGEAAATVRVWVLGRNKFIASQFTLADGTDQTKTAKFDASGISTATERTYGLPDADGTLALTGDIPTNTATVVDTLRQRIVNGDKLVSQENAQTSGTTNGRYISDQNAMYFVSSAGTFTGVNVLTLSPAGGYRDQITITVADASLAADEYLLYTQNLEGSNVRDLKWGTADAVDAVARFGFRGPAGTYAYRLGNSAGDRSFVALFTITAPEANTDTVQTIAVPGDTTGTWLNTDGVIGITRDIVLACGSTFQGTTGWQGGLIYGTSGVSNGMGTGAAVFQFFDEGFKADPDATGVYGAYEVGEVDAVYQPLRYLWSVKSAGTDPISNGFLVTSILWLGTLQMPVEMCKAPTLAVSAVADFQILSSAIGDTTGIVINRSTTKNVQLAADASVPGAGGYGGILRFDGGGSRFFNLIARLS